MAKGISEDAQIHISIAFLLKAMVAVALVVGSWYQAQMRFASIEVRLNDMHEELVVLTSKVHSMEKEHIQELETQKVALEEENRSLMQKLGLRKR
jgi:predicted transcriptional regulator